MANPIIKIKRGNGKPPSYSFDDVNLVQTGLTAGELGVNLNTSNSGYVLYIGDNTGSAITFGAELDSNSNLGISDVKIPTQKAVRDYISTYVPSSSSTEVVSYYNTAVQTIAANTEASVLFQTQEFASPSTGISGLAFNTNNTFQYSGSGTIYLLVSYQITWQQFATASQSYNSRNIVRSSWIQKSFSSSVAADNVYGFSTILLPPLIATAAGSIAGTQTATALISLTSGQSFSIRAKNHGTIPSAILNTATVNNTGTAAPVVNFNRASRVQVIKV